MSSGQNPFRYTVEQQGEYYYVFDHLKKEKLPYESANQQHIKGVAERLNKDYEEYQRAQAKAARSPG